MNTALKIQNILKYFKIYNARNSYKQHNIYWRNLHFNIKGTSYIYNNLGNYINHNIYFDIGYDFKIKLKIWKGTRIQW